MDILTIGIIVVAVVAFAAFIVVVSFVNTWLKALLAGAPVSMFTLVAMRLRGVPYGMIVDSRIMAVKAGLDLTINQLEEHYLAEGHLIQTIQALIASEKAGMDLSWKQACAIDLATKGTAKTVGEAVRTSINPKVIDCPSAGSHRLPQRGQRQNVNRRRCKRRHSGESPRARYGADESRQVCGRCAGGDNYRARGRGYRYHNRLG